jgi:hypothetical protein
MATLANYMFGSSFTYHVSHLEGEEVFGSTKRPVDCPPGPNNDLHRLDHVNFSHPQVIVHAAQTQSCWEYRHATISLWF